MGYSTDLFSSEPSESCTCAICHDVLKDACSLNCGHTFCAECIDACRASSNNPSCPNCRVELAGSHPNYAMRDVIGELAVRCPDSEECNWTGQVKDIESHGNTCMFKAIVCDVQGCDHTCQRKNMGEHTSDTNVKFKHMELKYDKKLKDMEEKYETTITQQETEMQLYKNKLKSHKNKLQTYERRIRALERRKRSAEDMSNNNSGTPDEMIVEGCGLSAVNGVYIRQGSYENAPMYVRRHVRVNPGQDGYGVFTLYRYLTLWFISIVPKGSRPGTTSDVDLYHVDSEALLPPRTGWVCGECGIEPPPTVQKLF